MRAGVTGKPLHGAGTGTGTGGRLDAEFTAATLSVYQIETFPICTLRYRGYLHASR